MLEKDKPAKKKSLSIRMLAGETMADLLKVLDRHAVEFNVYVSSWKEGQPTVVDFSGDGEGVGALFDFIGSLSKQARDSGKVDDAAGSFSISWPLAGVTATARLFLANEQAAKALTEALS